MNIFYLSEDVHECARMHCDKHVVKMVLETAQLLCTVQRMYGNDDESLYKPTHKNHPSCVWARESKDNYAWLYSLFLALLEEYSRRYSKQHACSRLVGVLSIVPDLPDIPFTQPTQAMPDIYKHHDSIIAYRTYYVLGKHDIATWNYTEQPYWWR